MGCKGSKHARHGGCGGMAALAPESPPQRRRRSGGHRLPPRHRHSVALRSSTLGTLSLDRAAAAVAAAGLSFDADAAAGGGVDDEEGMMKAGHDVVVDGAATKLMLPSRSFGGWRPSTPPPVAAPPATKKRQRRVAAVVVAPRTPNKTPVRDEQPEEINVWELMEGLDDNDVGDEDEDDGETDGSCGCGCVVHAGAGVDEQPEKKAWSAPGSPASVFDPELLDAFRKALDDLATPDSPSPSPRPLLLPGAAGLVVKRDAAGGGGGDDVVVEKKREIETFPGIVRARVQVFQEKLNAKTKLQAAANKASPPESAGRVVVYLTSLRGVRQTYEDCWSTVAILRGYGVRVDERDLSMHAGFKDELRAALGVDGGGEGRLPRPPLLLPQVFTDGRHLGGAEEVRRLHEAGALAPALNACDAAPCAATNTDGGACARCGGDRFVPCGGCFGSRKVFVEDVDGSRGGGGGAFRPCPKCNENGLVKCAAC